MTKEELYTEGNKDWNMAIAWLQRLDKLLFMVNNARIEGDAETWYRGLSTIVSMIHWKIAEEGNEKQEQEMLNTLEEVKTDFKRLVNTPQHIRKQGLTETELKLENLDTQVNDLLHVYNFLGMKTKKFDPSRAVEDFF